MKTKLILSWLMVLLMASCSLIKKTAEGPLKVDVNYEFINISPGFDHESKTVVRINGQAIAESEKHKQSQKKTISFVVPKGEYDLEIMNYAFFAGQWEEHTQANNYSQDCFYKGIIKLRRNTAIKLVFDLDKGTSIKIK
ncbi:MAG: hypothetical protein ISR55_00510 [Bacteroidetes bacterium]|nr:hypothetical protein [Bacteroidota bacterium]MBL6962284.1 hypothetical protein [Bacteroidota bacterium]